MSQFIREWNADKLKAKLTGELLNNMERAASFAEQQARANAPVRRGILKSHITHVVRARGNTIEGIVGVNWKAFWAIFVERGTSKMPQRAFLRPAVFGNAKEILRLLAGK